MKSCSCVSAQLSNGAQQVFLDIMLLSRGNLAQLQGDNGYVVCCLQSSSKEHICCISISPSCFAFHTKEKKRNVKPKRSG